MATTFTHNLKRPHNLASFSTEPTQAVTPQDRRKRAKMSPRDQQSNNSGNSNSGNSSDASRRSISESSALLSTPPPNPSLTSSKGGVHGTKDSDSETSVSSDSDSASDASSSDNDDSEEEQDPIITLGGPKKPSMRVGGLGDLKTRLSTFLPQLAAANSELEERVRNGEMEGKRFEDVDDGDEGYIEMDLGLGVLEEQKERGAESSSDDEVESDGEEDRVGKLMGQKRRKGGIQEVDVRAY